MKKFVIDSIVGHLIADKKEFIKTIIKNSKIEDFCLCEFDDCLILIDTVGVPQHSYCDTCGLCVCYRHSETIPYKCKFCKYKCCKKCSGSALSKCKSCGRLFCVDGCAKLHKMVRGSEC